MGLYNLKLFQRKQKWLSPTRETVILNYSMVLPPTHHVFTPSRQHNIPALRAKVYHITDEIWMLWNRNLSTAPFFVSAAQILDGIRLYFAARYDKLSVKDGVVNVWMSRDRLRLWPGENRAVMFCGSWRKYSAIHFGRNAVWVWPREKSENIEKHGISFRSAARVFLIMTVIELYDETQCGRLEWSCLEWNRPSINFYLSLDATPMDQWTIYRLTGNTLRRDGRGLSSVENVLLWLQRSSNQKFQKTIENQLV